MSLVYKRVEQGSYMYVIRWSGVVIVSHSDCQTRTQKQMKTKEEMDGHWTMLEKTWKKEAFNYMEKPRIEKSGET